MERTCEECRGSFRIPDEDLVFFEKVSPCIDEERFPLPPPKLCPDCRLQRRLSYRNEFQYYQRRCAKCAKPIVTVYSPEQPFPVYCHTCWWGDGWNAMQYGRTFDPQRDFLEQFFELRNEVPQVAMMNDNGVTSENCEYTQDFAYGKNCYLVTASWQEQDCMYCTQCNHVKDVLDSFVIALGCELVYESLHSQHLYSCSYLDHSSNCRDCHFGFDLRGCTNCFCCIGLRQKQYHIFNQPYSPEAYEAEIQRYACHSWSGTQRTLALFADFRRTLPRRAVYQTNCEACTGDSLFHCKDFHGTAFINGESCRYCWMGDGPVHCYDVTNTGKPQWCYEGITPDNSYLTHFTTWCWKDKYTYYSDNCHSSEHLLGCIGLRREKYCILNKRCTPEEYNRTARAILRQLTESGRWGEFFPMRRAPFAYNESRANDLFPLDAAACASRKLRYRAEEAKTYRSSQYAIPDSIHDTTDAILAETLSCEECRRNYRIQSPELAFYRKLALPVPHRCPNCRRVAREQQYPLDGKLYQRRCAECSNEVATVYRPEDPVAVLCEECYLRRVY